MRRIRKPLHKVNPSTAVLERVLSGVMTTYLAACFEEGRDDAIGALARDTDAIRQLIAKTRERGYGISDGDWDQQALSEQWPCH